MTTATHVDNPFPGLRSFEPDQADLFFGRDEQIEELVDRLQKYRFVAVVGTSGSGKSSLVRAGLLPALERSGSGASPLSWRIAIFRPGKNPLVKLAEALSGSIAGFQPETLLSVLCSSSAGLARFARQSLAPNEQLLIVVDQFEELFRYRAEKSADGENQDATAFVKLLLAASGHSDHPLPGFDHLPVYVVITMRSDFLGKCSLFGGLPEALNNTQYLVPRMTRDQQREVIEGPIGMAAASMDPALVQRLLNDVGDNPDQLPVLQHVLMRTWVESTAARARGEAMGVEHYEAVGEMSHALDRDANFAFAALHGDKELESIARLLFQRLVEPGPLDEETRRPTQLAEIVAVTAAPETKVREVVEVFRSRGFITISGDEDPVIDITHESLIRNWKQMKAWVEEESRSAAIYRRLAETPALYSKGQAGLPKDPELQLMLNWREEARPNEAWARRYHSGFTQAIHCLEDSNQTREDERERAEHQRQGQLKRARVTALVFGIFLLLAVSASILAIVQWKRTQSERDRSRRLLYDANIYSAQRAVAEGQIWRAQGLLDELFDQALDELRGFEWSHLWLLSHADEATLAGHRGLVTSVAFSPDGKILATGSRDNTIKLWDLTSRTELVTFPDQYAPITEIEFSPDGKTLASRSPYALKLWDVASGREMAVYPQSVGALAFSPDGKTIAVVGDPYAVELRDSLSLAPKSRLESNDWIEEIAFSPDGRTLAATSSKNLKFWDLRSGKALATFSGHTDFVYTLAFAPDGETLASAGADKTVKLWDTDSHQEVATLSGHTEAILSVAFSPDGKSLASCSSDKTVKVWDTALPYADLATLPGAASSVVFSPDGKTLASGSTDNTAKLWDAVSRKESVTLARVSDVSPGASFRIALSPDGKTLASVFSYQELKLWDIASRKELATLPGGSVNWLAFSPDGKILATGAGGGASPMVTLWDTASHAELARLKGHTGDIHELAFAPNGRTVASASADKTVKLWDTFSHAELATLSGHNEAVNTVAFSPDGKTLASAGVDEKIKLWDTASHKELATLSGHNEAIHSVAFSSDGRILASASRDKMIKLWDTASHAELATLSGHSEVIYALAFSPDGKTLASAGADKKIRLWDASSRKELVTLSSDTGAIQCLAFSRDGKVLASGSSGMIVVRFGATDAEVNERRKRGY